MVRGSPARAPPSSTPVGGGAKAPAGCGVWRGRGAGGQRRRRRGAGRACRPGAAPRGAEVQAGGDGGGRGRDGRVGRVRRPAGLRYKPAATAEEGGGTGVSAGCGAPRGRGSN